MPARKAQGCVGVASNGRSDALRHTFCTYYKIDMRGSFAYH
jgi:hypothetical protein